MEETSIIQGKIEPITEGKLTEAMNCIYDHNLSS